MIWLSYWSLWGNPYRGSLLTHAWGLRGRGTWLSHNFAAHPCIADQQANQRAKVQSRFRFRWFGHYLGTSWYNLWPFGNILRYLGTQQNKRTLNYQKLVCTNAQWTCKLIITIYIYYVYSFDYMFALLIPLRGSLSGVPIDPSLGVEWQSYGTVPQLCCTPMHSGPTSEPPGKGAVKVQIQLIRLLCWYHFVQFGTVFFIFWNI